MQEGCSWEGVILLLDNDKSAQPQRWHRPLFQSVGIVAIGEPTCSCSAWSPKMSIHPPNPSAKIEHLKCDTFNMLCSCGMGEKEKGSGKRKSHPINLGKTELPGRIRGLHRKRFYFIVFFPFHLKISPTQ